MDSYPPDRKRSRARERIAARQARRQPMVVERNRAFSAPERSSSRRFAVPEISTFAERIGLAARDLAWRMTHSTQTLFGLIGAVGFFIIVFILSHSLAGRIYPNVWSLGIPIGGLTVDEASRRLEAAWQRDMRIALVDADRQWLATPAELGLSFDALGTAESALAVGMAGIPFGYAIPPQAALTNELGAQNFLLDLSLQTNIPARNAGFRWEEETLLALAATEGKTLDVATTLGDLLNNPQQIVESRQLRLVMTPVMPELQNADQYLEAASNITSQTFQMTGYDPFVDERITWSTDRDTFTSWLEVTSDGLGLREELFRPFLDAQARTLDVDGTNLRFVEPTDAIDKLRSAIREGKADLVVRIRYRSSVYEVQSGDTGFRISRRTGIPFFLIQQANPNIDWANDILQPGDRIQLPTRDLVLPLDPVPNKRIVVNLNTQSLIAYENGQPVFEWLISSGIDTAPTSPGIYQIQSHEELASGSSFTLCGERGCGQWEMYWFMGIYEVIPGLMNGFHGNVRLPNGQLLGGGNVGQPYTFGCVMSVDEQARALYEWADQGTVVEIVSNEFAPQSALGRLATEQTGGI